MTSRLFQKSLSVFLSLVLLFFQGLLYPTLSLFRVNPALAVITGTFTANQTVANLPAVNDQVATTATTVANVVAGTNDQAATTATTVANVAETKASQTLTVAFVPANAETVTIGTCVVTFNTGATQDVDCSNNNAAIDTTADNSTATIATRLRSFTGVTDAAHGALTVTGAGNDAIFTTANTENSATNITFTDGTTGDITNVAVTGVVPVAQVNTITVAGTVDTGDVFTATLPTVGAVNYTVTGGDTTTTNIATGLNNAILASAGYASQAFTSGVATNVITLTAKVAGTGFTQTSGAINRAAVVQVNTITIGGTVESGDVVTATVPTDGAVNYTVTGGDTTTANVATGLNTAIQAATNYATQDFTSAVSGSVVTLTAKVAGTGFVQTSGTTNRTPIAQVVTFTPALVTVGETFRGTINGTNYDYLAASGNTVAIVVAALATSMDAHVAVACVDTTSTTVTCTASVAGTAFTFVATVVDVTAPSSFTAGTVVTTGGTIVASKWNSTNTGVDITIPVANDPTLTGGTIQLQAEADGAFENLGAAYTILLGDLGTNKTFSRTDTQLEALTGFSNGDNVTIRAVITDSNTNATTGTVSTTSLDVDQVTPTFTAVRSGMNEITLTFNENVSASDTVTTAWTLDAGAVVSVTQPSNSIALTMVTSGITGTTATPIVTYVAASGTVLDTAGNEVANGANATSTDGVSPTVTNVTSTTADGSYSPTQTVAGTVTFTENVTVTTGGGTPRLLLETGTTDRYATYVGGSGGPTLTFNYTVQAGDAATDLDYGASTSLETNGGTIRDAANNNATLTLVTPGAAGSLGANKAIVIDSVAPTAAITYSLNRAVSDPDTLVITSTFSEPVLDSPIPQVAISGANTLAATNMTKTSATVYTYSHNVGTGNGAATVVLSVGTDIAGNVVTATPTSGATFTVDNTTPTFDAVVTKTTTTIEADFSENIEPTSVAIADFTVASNTVTAVSVAADKVTLTVGTLIGTAAVPLVSLVGAVADIAGNTISSGSITPTDGIVPVLQSARTFSTTQIDLTFSEDLNGTTVTNTDFTVSGSTLTTPDATEVTPGVVRLTLATPITTSAVPSVAYTGSVVDLAGNVASTVSAMTPADGVAPTLTASRTAVNTIVLTFSENVSASDTATAAWTLSAGTIASVTQPSNSTTLTMVVSGITGTTETPTVTYVSASGTVVDGSSNEVANGANAVASDAAGPVVSNVTSSATNGTFAAGDTINVTVTFLEAVIVVTSGGTPRLLLETGTTDRYATYSSGSGSTSLVFTYIVQAGDSSSDLDYVTTSSLELNGGTLRDSLSNNAVLTLSTPGTIGSLGVNKSLVVSGTSTTLTSSTTVSTSTPQITINDISGSSATITIPSTVTNATLDLTNIDAISGSNREATLPDALTVNTSTSLGTVRMEIPSGTVITGGSSAWSGVINAPQIQSNTSISSPVSGNEGSVMAVVEVGFGDVPLTLSSAVRILIPGQAGRKAAYVRSGVQTEINTLCSADTQAAGDALSAGGDCRIDVGADMVIWTKHFTKFVSYTSTPLSGSGPVSCTDSKPSATPTLLSAVAGSNSVTLFWSDNSENATYYVVTYGDAPGKQQYGNNNIGGKGTTSFMVSGLSGGTTYYFRVRNGSGCATGQYSGEFAATPGGASISGPAAGFAAGVLGAKTQIKYGTNDEVLSGSTDSDKSEETPIQDFENIQRPVNNNGLLGIIFGAIFSFLGRLFGR